MSVALEEAQKLAHQSLLELELLKHKFESRGRWTDGEKQRLHYLADLLTDKQIRVDEHPDAGPRKRTTKQVQYVVTVAELLVKRTTFSQALVGRVLEDLGWSHQNTEEENAPSWVEILKEYAQPGRLVDDVRSQRGPWTRLPWGVRLVVSKRILSGGDNAWWYRPLPPPQFPKQSR